MSETTAVDMFVVATAMFRPLYTVIILGHNRRKVIHLGVTQNPTQIWLAHQMTEAFPWDTAPRYLLRDRDASYGPVFRNRLQAMEIREVVTAARSPWQNAYVERIIGSVRRECLDHVIISGERHLRGVLSSYFQYYHKTRTHLALDKDSPESRPIYPINAGKIIAFRQVSGLHHCYERRPGADRSGWVAHLFIGRVSLCVHVEFPFFPSTPLASGPALQTDHRCAVQLVNARMGNGGAAQPRWRRLGASVGPESSSAPYTTQQKALDESRSSRQPNLLSGIAFRQAGQVQAIPRKSSADSRDH
jgi:hypothetical protein